MFTGTTDDCNWTSFTYLRGHESRVLSAYSRSYLCVNKLKYSVGKENLTGSINQLSNVLGDKNLRRELGSLTWYSSHTWLGMLKGKFVESVYWLQYNRHVFFSLSLSLSFLATLLTVTLAGLLNSTVRDDPGSNRHGVRLSCHWLSTDPQDSWYDSTGSLFYVITNICHTARVCLRFGILR